MKTKKIYSFLFEILNPLKKCMWHSTVLAILIFELQGQAHGECPANMIGYWPLDEPANGIVADLLNANNGSCLDENCPALGEGRNGGLRFNGSNDVTIPPSEDFNWDADSSFTIELKMKKIPSFSLEEEILIARSIEPEGGWRIGLGSSGEATFGLFDSAGEGATLKGERNLADGNWHHWVVIRDGENNRIKIIIDNTEEAVLENVSYSEDFGSNSAPVTIGWMEQQENPYDGWLDELAIYNGVLADDGIEKHYRDGLADFRWGYCNEPLTIRIMPLGDSITAGVMTVNGVRLEDDLMTGYRQKLYFDLQSLGIPVDFVGSQTFGSGADPSFDADNEGHPGFSDSQIAARVFDWLQLNPADLVLLHIGTNELDPSPDDVEQILQEIDRFDQNITVYLARIVNRASYSETTTQFNFNVQAMAEQRIANGDKIVIVDQESALDYPDDMSDNLHPNPTGYEKMSRLWYNSLNSFYMFEGNEPSFVSTPSTSITVFSPYTYDVAATGVPAPTYSLIDGESPPPDGMAIDPNSGVITWRPFEEGQFQVNVQAENSVGRNVQTFTIQVSTRDNQPPVANAGNDMSAIEGSTFRLDASGSYDPDGGISVYKWEQISGQPVVLSDSSAINPYFVAPGIDIVGLIFQLTVEDAGGLNDTDRIAVSVNSNGISLFPEGVASFWTSTDNPLGIQVQNGGDFVKLNPASDASFTDSIGQPVDFLYGMVEMEIKTSQPGGSATIAVYLPEPAPDDYSWFEYNALEGWKDLSEHVVFNANRDRLTLTLTDGGIGDDGISGADGFIRNYSGLASEPASEKVNKDDLFSCFIKGAFFR